MIEKLKFMVVLGGRISALVHVSQVRLDAGVLDGATLGDIIMMAPDRVLDDVVDRSYNQIESLIRSSKETADEIRQKIRACHTYLEHAKDRFISMLEAEKQKYRKVEYAKREYEKRLRSLSQANAEQLPLF